MIENGREALTFMKDCSICSFKKVISAVSEGAGYLLPFVAGRVEPL